jgi:RNA polymerase sigma-70 factor (ECF subfamily)
MSEAEATQVRGLYDAARIAWPGIHVEFEAFAARLRDSQSAAYASDLYLACACAQGDEPALREFDRRYLAAVRAAVARVDPSPDFVTEVEQLLRERLFVGDAAKINEYRGTGPLIGWLRTAALRTALNLRRSRHRHDEDPRNREDPDDEDVALIAGDLDPEATLLRERHRDIIHHALRAALADLAPEQRVVLRWSYLDHLTLARIAVLQGVSVPTAHRRLAAATAAFRTSVRHTLTSELQLSTESLDSLIRGIDADMALSLSALFQAGPD